MDDWIHLQLLVNTSHCTRNNGLIILACSCSQVDAEDRKREQSSRIWSPQACSDLKPRLKHPTSYNAKYFIFAFSRKRKRKRSCHFQKSPSYVLRLPLTVNKKLFGDMLWPHSPITKSLYIGFGFFGSLCLILSSEYSG